MDLANRTLAMHEYKDDEIHLLPPDTRLVFSDILCNSNSSAILCESKHSTTIEQEIIPNAELDEILKPVQALRCSSGGRCCFSLYPTSAYELEMNKFLWRTAQECFFRATTASALFEQNVFTLCMPDSLFSFLQAVTWEELEEAMIHILATLAENDEEGRAVLQAELAPGVFSQVEERLHRRHDGIKPPPPRAFRLAMDSVLECIYSLGPWTIPCTTGFLTPADIRACRKAHETCLNTIPAHLKRKTGVHAVLWALHEDWIVYERFLSRSGRVSRERTMEAMTTLIATKSQCKAWHAVYVLLCSSMAKERTPLESKPKRRERQRAQNLLELLPQDVLIAMIAPRVILDSAQAAPLRAKGYGGKVMQGQSEVDIDEILDMQEESVCMDEDGATSDPSDDIATATAVRWNLKYTLLENPVVLVDYYQAV